MSKNNIKMCVIQIWSEVLAHQVEEGVDFFEEGGHSIAIVQLVDRVRAEFDAEISVRDVFENSRLVDFVALVEARVGETPLT